MLKVSARPVSAAVPSTAGLVQHVVVTLEAPAIAWQQKRPALCLALVVDTSGSMAGEKIGYARDSILKLIEHLAPDDQLALVSFASFAKLHFAPLVMTPANKERARQEVRKLSANGGTDLSGGLLTALQTLEDADVPSGVVCRALFFTDGQPSGGVATTTPQLVALLSGRLGQPAMGRISVSAFGYGRDVDQTLLTALSTAGKGNYAFVSSPDESLSAFAGELGGLMSVYAQNVEVKVAGLGGHEVTALVSDVPSTRDEGGVWGVKLESLLAEETRHLVFAVKLQGPENPFPRPVSILDAAVAFDVTDAVGKVDRKTLLASAKIEFVKAGQKGSAPDAELDAVVGRAEMTHAQKEAEARVKGGDFAGAYGVVAALAVNLGKRGHKALEHVANKVASGYDNASSYQKNAGYLQTMSRGMTRGLGVSHYDAQAQADMDSIGAVYSNSSQESMLASFTGRTSSVAALGAVVQPTIAELYHPSASPCDCNVAALQEQVAQAMLDPDYSLILDPSAVKLAELEASLKAARDEALLAHPSQQQPMWVDPNMKVSL